MQLPLYFFNLSVFLQINVFIQYVSNFSTVFSMLNYLLTVLVNGKWNVFAGTASCPVATYKEYARRRPTDCCQPDSRFYLQPVRNPKSDTWFNKIPMGKNTIGNLAKNMAEKANLTSSRITNHSARKTAIQTLLHADVPPASVMQLSGHKNIQSLNSYSTLSIDQQRDLSNILSDRTNFTNLADDYQNDTFAYEHQESATGTDFIDDDDLASLVCGQSNSLEVQELGSTSVPAASYHLSLKNNQIRQPAATGVRQFSFLNGTVNGNDNVTANMSNSEPSAKRRHIRPIIDSDSDSEE